ncbi:hypothetical protein AA3271_0031 [Gluconobacter japonicus NBRC 3271]|nr:hypothetical protein AA3271_0031 [Gluconobacter japonicus NBRC 3271]
MADTWVVAPEVDQVVGSRAEGAPAEALVEALTAVLVRVVAAVDLAAEVALEVQAVDAKPLAEHQDPMASGAFLRERALCDPLSQGPRSPI